MYPSLEIVGENLMKVEREIAREVPGKKVIFKYSNEKENEEEYGVKYQTCKDFYKKK